MNRLITILLLMFNISFGGSEHLFVANEKYGWAMQPNHQGVYKFDDKIETVIKSNSYGFRDSEWDSTGEKIAVLGDSFVIGLGVEKPFTEYLQDSVKCEVMNFGMNGYSPLQEKMILEDIVLSFRPKIVILCIYVRNDFDDLACLNWIADFKRPYLENGLIKYKEPSLIDKAGIFFRDWPEKRHSEGFYFSEMQNIINDIYRLTILNGTEFILLIAPSIIIVSDKNREIIKEKYGNIDIDRPVRFLQSLGYSTILPDLTEKDYLANQHWNDFGHKKVANDLYNKIRTMK